MPSRNTSRPTRRGPLGPWIRRIVIFASLLFLFRTTLVHRSEIAGAWQHLVGRSWWVVVSTLGVEALWTLSLANVYRSSLLAFGGSLSRRHMLRVSMGAFSLSRILPGGGAAGSVFAAREIVSAGNRPVTTVVSMLVSWWISMVTLASIVGIGILVGVSTGHVAVAHLVAPGLTLGVLLAGAVVVLAVLRIGRLRAGLLGWAGRLGTGLGVGASADEWDRMAGEWVTLGLIPHLLRVGLWTAAGWLADAAALWMMFFAFGQRLHPGVLLVGYGLANLINALPEVTPGWLGVLEAALAATYAGFGVPSGVAVMAVLSYRLVSYWVPVAAGLPYALRLIRGTGRPVAEPAAGTARAA